MGASFRRIMPVVILLVALLPGAAVGQGAAPDTPAAARIGPVSGLALPRFVTLRATEVNLRTGPGLQYPIEWVYTRSGLPVEVIDEFETWRQVRDWEGSIGWVHQIMLTGTRRVLVVGKQRLLRRVPEDGATGLALLEAGVTGRLDRCAEGWCKIEVEGVEGWLRDDEVFGVAPGDDGK